MRILKSCRVFLVLFILCGSLAVGNAAVADTIIDAQPDTSTTESKKDKNKTTEATTEKTTSETPTSETPTTEESAREGWSQNHRYYYRNGKKVKGFKNIDGKKYYFNSNGKLYLKTGMRKINGKYYYFSKAHTLKTGVVKVKNKAYYFKQKNGQRYENIGIRKVDGKYYCFKKNHTLVSGWYRNEKNKLYFFSTRNYAGLNGWNYINSYKYYFNNKGMLVQDVRNLLTEKQRSSYMIYVNRAASCVTVYTYDEGGTGYYNVPVVAFVCSGGEATPLGQFTIRDKIRWHELDGPSWGQWCEHLTDSILFHSVYYDRKNDNHSLNVDAYNRLGTVASHGCIRLTAGDAKWIYDNCGIGTRVVIYDDANNPGPFDKPTAQKLAPHQTWDPTDPNP